MLFYSGAFVNCRSRELSQQTVFVLTHRAARSKMLWRLCKLHLGREVSIYVFCGTLAAKVNLRSTVSSGEKRVLPDGRDQSEVSSGKKPVWPDET